MCVTTKVSDRFPNPGKIPLALVDIKGLGSRGVCFGKAAGGSLDMSQIEQGIGVMA